MRFYIIANWKMNPTRLSDARRLVAAYGLKRLPFSCELVICPPDIFLAELSNHHAGNFSWGAQDCFWEASGPYTGEVSPGMLRSLGVSYVIVGHSERREHLQETDAMINKKVLAVLQAELSPILCVGGGPAAKSKQTNAETIVSKQLAAALRGVHRLPAGTAKLLVAYEPTWAISGISGNKAASPAFAATIARHIRRPLTRKYGRSGESVPILYGGSINANTIGEFSSYKEFNGFLVGGVSLKPKEFIEILKR